MNRSKSVCREGFTLIELMVVMVIIAVIVGIISGVAVIAQKKQGITKAGADIERLKIGLEEYRVEFGSYPSTANWQFRLLNVPNPDPDLEFIDPWRNNYQYDKESRFVYRLWSTGPDPDPTNTVDDIEFRSDY